MAAPTAALGRIPTRAPRTEAVRFASVYERHHQALYRYCRSILRHEEDAQDALQSAMMRAFAALQTERRELELRPWLFRIAHNEAVSILRRRAATCALDEELGDAAALEDRVFEREALRLLRADLEGLTERQRSSLVLRELNGLAHEEIAVVLDTTPSAVKQAIFEARNALLRCREGRDTACGDIRRVLSDGDGRVLRGRRVRAHLQTCPGCRAFREELAHRPRELAALAPPLPAGAAAALLRWVGGGGGSAGAVAAGSSAGGGVAAGLAAKAAVAVVLAGGAVALHAERAAPPPASAASPNEAPASGAPGRVEGHLAGARPIARRTGDASGRTRRGIAAPRGASHLAGRTTAPGVARTESAATTGSSEHAGGQMSAPGQAREETSGSEPSGQSHDEGTPAAVPEGTSSPQAGKGGAPAAAPGRAGKGAAGTSPGQAREGVAATTPPGRSRENVSDAVRRASAPADRSGGAITGDGPPGAATDGAMARGPSGTSATDPGAGRAATPGRAPAGSSLRASGDASTSPLAAPAGETEAADPLPVGATARR